MFRTPEELRRLSVPTTAALRDALRVMDAAHVGFVAVVDNRQRLEGIVTDGDFRRAILAGRTLDELASVCMNRQPVTLRIEKASLDAVTTLFRERAIRHAPIVDDGGVLRDVALWLDIDRSVQDEPAAPGLDCEAVIMAGGKGTRLDPFTRVLPKALIPIGEKTILEFILERFRSFGIRDCYVTVHHQASMIRLYLESSDLGRDVHLVEETEPLGTAGALGLLAGRVRHPFFVVNCDVIVTADYARLYDFHRTEQNRLTVVGSVRHIPIPYGVCEIENGGRLRRINEKPEIDVLVNTGMYVLSPQVLDIIPGGREYHMTHLIEDLLARGDRVGVFPVSEGSWMDTGQWEEYQRTAQLIGRTEAESIRRALPEGAR